MVPLSALWLPILVSAVFVFIASNIMWMALPFRHRGDYGKLPDEKTVLDGLSAAKNGQYMVPSVDWNKMTPEEREEMQRGPMALLLLRNPAHFSMVKAMVLWFLYPVVISVFVAYLAGHTLPIGSISRSSASSAQPVSLPIPSERYPTRSGTGSRGRSCSRR